MLFSKCFIFMVVVPFSISEHCSENDSLFDRALEKVLRSERFSEIILPDFWYNVGILLPKRVGFFEGKLHGLRNIRRNGRSVLNVEDTGSRLNFHIVGGPFVARYNVGLRTGFGEMTFKLGVEVPQLHASFTVQESSPGQLQLEVHGVRMSRKRVIFDDSVELNVGGPIYEIVFSQLRPFIQNKVGQLVAQELRKLAEETIGAVKIYAATTTTPAMRERESPAGLGWRNPIGSARSYLALINGRNPGHNTSPGGYSGGRQSHRSAGSRPQPLRTELERQEDIFDGCLETIVVSMGFEPATLPHDLEEISVASGRVSILTGNVTGMSSIRRNGDSSVMLDDCGLRARFSLGFKGLTVTAAASYTRFFVSINVIIEMQIPQVEAVLEIKENSTGLHVVAYELNFTAPVVVKAKPLGAVGTAVNFVGGLSEITLGIEELKQLEDSTLRYVQRIAHDVQDFIADPPLQPNW